MATDVVTKTFNSFLAEQLRPDFNYWWDIYYAYVDNYTFDPTDDDIDDLDITGESQNAIPMIEIMFNIGGTAAYPSRGIQATDLFAEIACQACGIVLHRNRIPFFYIEFPSVLQCAGGFEYAEDFGSGRNYGRVNRFLHHWDETRNAAAVSEWG